MNYYDFAIKDYNSAIIIEEHTEEYDVIVIHCQQYFEKSFKRLLELKSGQLLTTNKLTTLVDKLALEEFTIHNDIFRKMQDYCFYKRYPSEDYVEISKEEMTEVFNLMLKLKPVIETYITRYEASQYLKTIDVFTDL